MMTKHGSFAPLLKGNERGELKLLAAVVARAGLDAMGDDDAHRQSARAFFRGYWFTLYADWLELSDVARERFAAMG